MIVISMLLAGCLPALFQGTALNFPAYLNAIGHLFLQLLHPQRLTYQGYGGIRLPVFPDIFTPYFYSMKIFFAAFLLSFLAALIAMFLTLLLPRRLRQILSFMIFLSESLPDIFFMVALQVLVITLFQRTGFLMMNIAEDYHSQIYALPILCLSVLPACFFYRIMMLTVNEELRKDYSELARSKGLTLRRILLIHIFRNLLIPILTDSKTIIWMMLSNLVVMEFLFGIHGLTSFIDASPTPAILTIGLLLIGTPFFLLFTLLSFLIDHFTGQRVVI